ncbi:MAG: hypothetical protein EA405_06485 [Rhodospirillales bacterium]|nr:MAG: hypothetical protein EA405_06485 [Rhodospirillales bacterium]TVR99908.1 MAG: hypothetical protein EA406_01950 [Rhodospirillales bacterium]
MWRRLPRAFYWVTGAAVALLGAIIFRDLAEGTPLQTQFIIWMIGSVFVFLGLVIVSIGVKARLHDDDDDQGTGGSPPAPP